MVSIKSFKATRPSFEMAQMIADHPYDVVSTAETREILKSNPDSILKVDRAESVMQGVVFDDPVVYEKAKELLQEYLDNELLVEDDKSGIYIYEETFMGRIQRGVVCLSSCEDYLEGIVRIHENTIAAKEADRTNHIDITGYHIGPIFLIYRENARLKSLVEETVMNEKPLFDFTKYNVRHRGFKAPNPTDFIEAFETIGNTYVADGHHRSKSAINVYLADKEGGTNRESDYFLSVIFPSDEVNIMPYNRYIKSLKGYEPETFLDTVKKYYSVQKIQDFIAPNRKYEISIYLSGESYCLTLLEEYRSKDPLEGLDVYTLQKYVFDEILKIEDARVDPDVEFIGGIRGLNYLKDRVDRSGGVAFALYPTDVLDLLAVADKKQLMPAKSTWFEPKLLNGLFLHRM